MDDFVTSNGQPTAATPQSLYENLVSPLDGPFDISSRYDGCKEDQASTY